MLSRRSLRANYARVISLSKFGARGIIQYTGVNNQVGTVFTATKATLFHNIQIDFALVTNHATSVGTVHTAVLMINRKNQSLPIIQPGSPVSELVRPEQNVLAIAEFHDAINSSKKKMVVNNDSFRLGPGDELVVVYNIQSPPDNNNWLACVVQADISN